MGNTGKGTNNGGGVESPTSVENSMFSNALDLDSLPVTEQLGKIHSMQAAMGQTGDEAGKADLPHGSYSKMYVNCSKAFDINYYLATGKVGAPNSTWTSAGYHKSDIQDDIEKIDKGMKPLSESVKAFRYSDGAALGKMLGDSQLTNSNISNLISALENDKVARADFATQLKNADYTHPAYTSLTYTKKHPGFDNMPIRLDFVARKGTNAIVTNNHIEHEIIGAHGLKYNFTGNFKVEEITSSATGKSQKQLVIEVYI